MPHLSFSLRTISPLFLNGADTRRPEFRAASVRGQLRYWLRAILGAHTTDLKQIWKWESAVLGSTSGGSPVSVRFYAEKEPQSKPEQLLPHRTVRNRPVCNPQSRNASPSPMQAIPTGTICHLVFVTPPGKIFDNLLLKTIATWLLLGGIGKRSRRMFGALQITGVEGTLPNIPELAWWKHPPTEPSKLHEIIENHIAWVFHDLPVHPSPASMPMFPTLHPKHSRILVGYQAYHNARDANIALFNDLLRKGDYCKYDYMFGYAARNRRRASPLIAQVRQAGKYVYPVLTVMRSKLDPPRSQTERWNLVSQFVKEAIDEDHFYGESVWGEL